MARAADQILQVKQANDLVAVIQEYEELQRAGRNYRMCCPFHEGKHGGRENTPSLYIYPDKQVWHCFGGGCGQGGSVIDWVMSIEGVEFADALKMLAERAGIDLEPLRKAKPRSPGEVERDQLLELMVEARDWFVAKYPESKADHYVRDRGISDETVREFGIGYAPEGWENLRRALSHRWSEKAIRQSGLVVERDDKNSIYDRFRDRLIIPICDPAGNVVGFGARDLSGGSDGAKYINTPQTEVYNKSKVLFGINRARDAIRRDRHAILMEGYTDVMLAHQFGVNTAVATCGTSLTEGHLGVLRQAEKLTLLFDGDKPGIRAAERALELVVEHSINAQVVTLPDYLDPADFLLAHGAEAFADALEHGRSVVPFKAWAVRQNFDFDNPVEQAKAVEDCLALIKRSPSPVYREALLQGFSRELGMPEEALRKQLGQDLAIEAEREARRQRYREREARDARGPDAATERAPAPHSGSTWDGEPEPVPPADLDAYSLPPDDPGYALPSGSSGSSGSSAGGAAVDAVPPGAPPSRSDGFVRRDRRAAERVEPMRLSEFVLQETAVAAVLAAPWLVGELEEEFGSQAFPDGPLRRIVIGMVDLMHADPDADMQRDTLVSDLMTLLDDDARLELRQLIERHIGDRFWNGTDDDTDADDDVFDAPDAETVFAECLREFRSRENAREITRELQREIGASGGDGATEESRRLAMQHLEALRARKNPRHGADAAGVGDTGPSGPNG